MKKLYFLFLVLFSVNVNATNWLINVTTSGFSNPVSFNPVVGDVVTWHLISGSHTSSSLIIPGTALAWDQILTSTDFSYNITVAGDYTYYCKTHISTSEGSFFTVSPVGINEPQTNLITSVYPNPFNDKVTIKYNGIESIEVFNVIGDKVKMMDLSAIETKTEIDFSNLPSGIYFYRTYKEGTIVETRKIVKSK